MGAALSVVWSWLWPGWSQVWPNMLASILWAVPVFAWQHRRLAARYRAELVAQTEQVFAALADQTEELHDRVFGADGRHAKGPDRGQ